MDTPRIFQSIKYIFIIIGVFSLFSISNNAYATGGMLIIQQISNTKVLGRWVLTTPDGNTYADNRGEYIRKIGKTVGGIYSLKINAPRKANTNIVITKGNDEVIRSIEGTSISFWAPDGEAIRITITYKFHGTVSVDSNPPGQQIALRGKSFELTGVTPVTFNNVPPLYYSVDYGSLEGCIAPRRQSRLLEPSERLEFNGVYRCEDKAVLDKPNPKPEPKLPSPKLIDLLLRSNQSEVLPGGIVRYTLTVRNIDRTTHKNLLVSVQFDPNKGYISGVRNNGKILQDNLLIWNIPTLYAGQKWTTGFNMKANNELSAREEITMMARVEGSNLVEAGMQEHQLSHTIRIITILPKTGWKADLMLAMLLALVSIPFALTIRRRQFVAIKTV